MRIKQQMILIALMSVQMAHAQDGLEHVQDFDVRGGALDRALLEFGKQARLDVSATGETLRAHRTQGVQGRHTARDALLQLLGDTGLTFRVVDNTVQVRSAAASEGTFNQTQAPDRLAQVAQQGSRTASANLDRTSFIDEVIVTAQKREERLIEVPQAVAVLSAEDLSRVGALQFRDFADSVPGLSMNTTGPGYTLISLRGVTTGFIETSATVGIYVDEVPYGSSSAFAQGARSALDVGLFDLERLEVLKGPQGTLYGASTMGGLLKYVTKRPMTNSFAGEIQAGVAGTTSGGVNYNASAAVNLPVVDDKAALRVSGYYSRDGGYIDNVARNDDDANAADTYGGRVDFLFSPTDALSIRLTGFAQDIDREGEGTADYAFDGTPQDGVLDQRRAFSEPFKNRFRLAAATITYDFGRASLTSVSSYQTAETDLRWDGSQFYVPILESFGSYGAVGINQLTTTDKFTQELRLRSAGSRRFEWGFGAFYTREDSGAEQEFVLQDEVGNAVPNDLFTYSAPSLFEEYAVFADVTWHLTDKFNVAAGARYAQNDQELEQFGSGVFASSYPLAKSSEDVVTYLANARYHFNQHATAYVRFATGYRPGGPTYRFLDPATGLPVAPPSFEADKLKSYEIGLKSETDDRRFGIDTAIYYIDWNNLQLNVCDPRGFCYISNAPGGATVRGVELALSAMPTEALRVSASFAHNDAEMSDADPALGAADGERLPGVPRFAAAVSIDYEFQSTGLQPSLGLSVQYTSDRMALFNNHPTYQQYYLPDYTTVSLRAGMSLGAVDIELYGRNLFDERGQLSTQTWFGNSRLAIMQPRTLGISARTRF